MFRKDPTEAVLFLQHLTRHKGTYTLKHACFLNIDATNGGCHYVSVRMCERENRTQDPLLLQFIFNRYQTIVFVHSLPSSHPAQFEKGHA